MTNSNSNSNSNNDYDFVYLTTYDLSSYSEFKVIYLDSDSKQQQHDLCFSFSDEFDGSSISSNTSDTVSIKSFPDDYTILKYNKDYLYKPMMNLKKIKNKQKYDTLGLFRSLVFNKERLLSFAPPKSYDFEDLIQDITSYYSSHPHPHHPIRIKPFIDGTLIHVFYDGSKWKIATRSVIDAKSNFYHYHSHYHSNVNVNVNVNVNSKSFHDMFYDCLHYTHFDLNTLDKRFSYSFVMQHPENRIVSPVHEPNLYLCGVYQIENNRFVNNQDKSVVCSYRIHQLDLEHHNNVFISHLFKDSNIHMIQSISNMTSFLNTDTNSNMNTNTNTKTKTLADIYISRLYTCISELLNPNTPYYIQGYVFEFMGKRYKIINEHYRYVRRELRGNQAKLQYQFYHLRRQNRIQEYLTIFPEDSDYFQYLEHQLNQFIGYIYRLYVDTFIRKIHSLNDADMNNSLRHQLHGIHKLYLEYLFPRYRKVTYHDVYLHITCMEPAQLMSSVKLFK